MRQITGMATPHRFRYHLLGARRQFSRDGEIARCSETAIIRVKLLGLPLAPFRSTCILLLPASTAHPRLPSFTSIHSSPASPASPASPVSILCPLPSLFDFFYAGLAAVAIFSGTVSSLFVGLDVCTPGQYYFVYTGKRTECLPEPIGGVR